MLTKTKTAIRSRNISKHNFVVATVLKSAWVDVGFNVECDGSAGEAYLKSSPGKVSNIEQCKDSCQSNPKCKSMTFLKSRWCSHFSTSCTKTKWRGKAIALRLVADTTPTSPRRWQQVQSNTACDTTKGELFMNSSRKRISSLEECKKLCEAAAGCQSITYYKGGYCGHYSTSCMKVRYVGKAVGTFRLVSSKTMLRRV